MKRRWLALIAMLLVAGAVTRARAQDRGPDDLFAAALAALHESRTNDAIASFEALGDTGLVDPVVSFDRGLAYAQRVRAAAEIPGDLGRAAHGFEEARELTADPALEREATDALSIVRAEVARRRSQAGDPVDVDEGLPLGRAIASLLPEDAWAIGALVAGALLGAALFVRWLAVARRVRIGAAITLSVAAPALGLFAILAMSARDDRLHLREGVIVATSARLSDDRHIALPGQAPLPEALRVVILDSATGWTKVRAGAAQGWIPSPTVRPIARSN
jgi:hypothetical protein